MARRLTRDGEDGALESLEDRALSVASVAPREVAERERGSSSESDASEAWFERSMTAGMISDWDTLE